LANGIERGRDTHPRQGLGRLFNRRWLFVLAYLTLVFVLSAQPNLHVPGDVPYRDKYAHLLEYGGLSWLVYRAVRGSWPAAGATRRVLLSILALSAVGALDEKSQAGVPGRDSSAYDWMADTVGVSLVQVVSAVLEKRRGVS
jgi:VanZ family protein